MLKLLIKQNRHKESLFLAILTLVCFGLSIFRCIYTDSKLFLFLNWNLFLAFIPWALSSITIMKPKITNNKSGMISIFMAWLLFFPNAPYILTDLFHLGINSSIPQWFDLLLLLFFAWTGLLYGFLSLRNMEQILHKSMSKTWSGICSVLLLFIGSFGVYMGRFLRWNSWDIIRDPFGIYYSIEDRILNPTEHLGTWGMTILMGCLLNMMYWSFRFMKTKNESI